MSSSSSSSSSPFCVIPESDFGANFSPKAFHNTKAIQFVHEAVPRYGKPNDILLLVNGSEGEKKDYLRGLLASAITIFSIFLVWTCVLLYFKWQGPQRYGWLSGRRVVPLLPPKPRNPNDEKNKEAAPADDNPNLDDENHKQDCADDDPPEGSNEVEKNDDESQNKNALPNEFVGNDNHQRLLLLYEEDMVAWNHNYVQIQRERRFMKGLVIFSAFFIILSSLLMCIKGVDGLQRAMADGHETIGYADDLIQNGVEFMDSLIEALTNVMADIGSLLEVANGICPNVRAQICTVLTDSRTCNSEGIFDNDIFEKVVDHFNSINRTIVPKLTNARQDLADMLTVTRNMEENVDTFDWALYIAMVFAILLSLLALGMIVGLVIRKTDRMICLQSRFFFPLFVSLVVLSFVFSIAFVIASLALSDTCVDDPDARLLSVAAHYLDGGSPILFEFVQLYLSRCIVKPVAITAHLDFLQEGTDILGRFSDAVVEQQIVDVCAGGATTTLNTTNTTTTDVLALLATATTTANEYLCTTTGILRDLRSFFQCQTWYPLYRKTVHDAMCYSATDGFSWIASTQFVVVFMAMIILTCRVVFLYDDDDDNEKKLIVVPGEALLLPTESTEKENQEMLEAVVAIEEEHEIDGAAAAGEAASSPENDDSFIFSA